MVRRILLPIALFAVLALAVVFAALNPGANSVDLGFAEARLQKSLALALAFGAGWLFGVLCLAAVLVRMTLDRRRLRKSLRMAEGEVHALRSIPSHAD
jgi:uncharacterized membrane protein YciS (DUF1049 family)